MIVRERRVEIMIAYSNLFLPCDVDALDVTSVQHVHTDGNGDTGNDNVLAHRHVQKEFPFEGTTRSVGISNALRQRRALCDQKVTKLKMPSRPYLGGPAS